MEEIISSWPCVTHETQFNHHFNVAGARSCWDGGLNLDREVTTSTARKELTVVLFPVMVLRKETSIIIRDAQHLNFVAKYCDT